jgi:hypothetical protein
MPAIFPKYVVQIIWKVDLILQIRISTSIEDPVRVH